MSDRDSHDEWKELNPACGGLVPVGAMVPYMRFPPPTWTPRQIALYQAEWDKMIREGNTP
jgi:hypothetical protein